MYLFYDLHVYDAFGYDYYCIFSACRISIGHRMRYKILADCYHMKISSLFFTGNYSQTRERSEKPGEGANTHFRREDEKFLRGKQI